MPITKSDLNKALLQQQKTLLGEISKFLEKHVIEPIFDLKKDVGILKKDMKGLEHDVEQINRKLDNSIINRADRHGEKIDDHEKRISSLEISGRQI